MTWTPPPEALGDEITAYDLRYILTSADESDDANWTVRTRVWTSGPLRSAQSGLTNGSGYDIQVRAVNSEGVGTWSSTVQGTPADLVNVRLQWASSDTTVDENAGSVTLQVEIVTAESGTVDSGFSVDVDVGAEGTASTPADYTLQPTALTFSAGDFTSTTIQGQVRYRAVKDIVVTLADDAVNEGAESFTLTLTYDEPSLPHLLGNNDDLTITIGDDDHGPISLSWETPSVSVDEGAGVVVLRALAITGQNVAPALDFSVQASVTAIEGTAQKGVDYSPLAGAVVFSGSAFSRTTIDGQSRYRAAFNVTVPILEDDDDEPDEELTVVIAFLNPTLPHLQGSSATATVTIRDNDFVPVTIGWDQSTLSLEEHGAAATLEAAVTTATDKLPESGFSVLLSATTADDTAMSGSDYRPLSRNLTFQQSDFVRVDVGGLFRYQATQTITVPIIEDTVDEPDEVFTVTLAYRGAMHNHYTGGSAEATVTIIDNELPEVTLGWEDVTFSLEEPTTPGGSVAVTLTAVASTLADTPPEPGFTLDYSVTTADGTAVAPADYRHLSETKSIPHNDFVAETVGGQTVYRATRTYTVHIEDDTVDEEDETFTVTLAFDDPRAPYLIPGDMTATITITDNDHVAVTLGWQQTSLTIDEPTSGGAKTVGLLIRAVTEKDKRPEPGFVLNYSVNIAGGTAQEPADYRVLSNTSESLVPSDFSSSLHDGRRVFVTTKSLVVEVFGDTLDEPDETVTVDLRLTDPGLPHLRRGDTRAWITINDSNHVPVELSWEQSSFTVDEDTQSVTLTAQVTTTVDKMPEPRFAAAVSVETVDGSATAGFDYTRLSTSHSFQPNDFNRIDTGGGVYRYRATRDFTVRLQEDTVDEESEQFQVVLAYTNPSLPHLTGGSAAAAIAITDNDHVAVTLGWAETQFTVEEPTSVGDTTAVTLTAQAVTAKDKRPESGFTFDLHRHHRRRLGPAAGGLPAPLGDQDHGPPRLLAPHGERPAPLGGRGQFHRLRQPRHGHPGDRDLPRAPDLRGCEPTLPASGGHVGNGDRHRRRGIPVRPGRRGHRRQRHGGARRYAHLPVVRDKHYRYGQHQRPGHRNAGPGGDLHLRRRDHALNGPVQPFGPHGDLRDRDAGTVRYGGRLDRGRRRPERLGGHRAHGAGQGRPARPDPRRQRRRRADRAPGAAAGDYGPARPWGGRAHRPVLERARRQRQPHHGLRAGAQGGRHRLRGAGAPRPQRPLLPRRGRGHRRRIHLSPSGL